MSGNFDAFQALEESKKQKILDAAIEEFAIKGYKGASTNAIVKKAEIGKGMLFYYFGSKEELFDFICEYTIEFVKNEYVGNIAVGTGDFLERYKRLTEIKKAAMAKYPFMIRFFESFYLPENREHFEKYNVSIESFRKGVMSALYDDIDYSLFKDEIPPENIVKYIRWLMDGYEKELTNRLKSGEFDVDDELAIANEWKRYDVFMKELRKMFYN